MWDEVKVLANNLALILETISWKVSGMELFTICISVDIGTIVI